MIIWRRIRRHSRLWRLSTAESEYISITKGAAHALEVRSAMVEYGMTFNAACETDASAGRAMATRRGVGRVRHLDARLLWLQQLCAEGVVEVRARLGEHNEADLGTKMVDLRRMTSLLKGTTLSAANGLELVDGGDDSPRGCRGSKRLQCIDLEREEHVRDEWLILDLCGNGHCDLDGVVNPISVDFSRQRETDENAAWRRPMKNELKRHEKVFISGLCVELCCEWCGLRA